MAMSICSKEVGRGLAVLMARIVDSDGVAIRPSDVSAIEYSVYELDPFWPEQLSVMRGHRAVRLDVGDVLFDSLQVGRCWGIDDVGYNFRHEIQLVQERPVSNAEYGYEVLYQLTLCNGRRTSVRFKLRSLHRETPSPALPARGREFDRALNIRRRL